MPLRTLFFPRKCLMCANTLSGDETCFCRHCLPRLPRTRFDKQPDNPAEQLFFGKCEIERVACFCYFEKGGTFRNAIHQFKYHDSPKTAFRLGALYAREIAPEWSDPIDLLIPVPLHWYKQLQRGYNQSEWIARGLASVWHKPIRTDILSKRQNTSTQTRKSIYDRYRNTAQAFRLRSTTPLAGKHILLVDDVLTSGSTLEACAQALQAAEGIKISILTLGFAE
ncbi:MAG: phosphoribosyltransferase family protein [Bacteroidales bacterium]